MCHVAAERVAGHYMAPFAAADVNFGQWSNGSGFAGAEIAYNIPVMGEHYTVSGYKFQDTELVKGHCSIRLRAGVRLEKWVFNVHYEYDLAPSFNQKYVYESAQYDFVTLRPSLYERHRVGISVAYLFTF